MLRNRNRNHDFMGYEPPMPQRPEVALSTLEPTNERMLDLSETVGQLGAQNDMLNEDNRRLEQENQELRERNKSLAERNTRLEREDSAFEAATKLIDEVKEAVTAKKGTK